MTEKKNNIEEIIENEDIKENPMKVEFTKIPLIPLRAVAVIPGMVTHFDVGREKSILALEKAMEENGQVFLVMQRDASIENPKRENMYEYGTIANVKQVLRLPGRSIRNNSNGATCSKIAYINPSGMCFQINSISRYILC